MANDTKLICPKCQSPMRSYERSGITVDQCTGCQGIFLDRGELARLMEAEDVHYGGSAGEQGISGSGGYQGGGHHGGYQGGGHHGGDQRGRRRGFLGSLFDD